MDMLFPEQYFSCAMTAYPAFWNTCKRLVWLQSHWKQAGIPSPSNTPFFPYTPTTRASISVYSHSTFEFQGLILKTQNQALKFWQYERHSKAGAGTYQEPAALRALSQQGSCSELRYIVWESTQTAGTAKRFPQHLYLETNHQSFLSTKGSTTITHSNHISFEILACQKKPKHPALGFWSEFPGHTVFSSGYGIAEQELPTSHWRLCLPIQ